MKKTIVAVLGLAIFALGTSSAQDLKEILNKHFKAIGQEKILDINSQVSTGKISQMGMEMPFKSITKRPGKSYMEMEIEGTKMAMGFDGEKGWAIQPWTGSMEPVDLVGSELRPLREMSDLDGSLWNYEEKGHQMELVGTEDVEGSKVYVLKLTRKSGEVFHYYIDSEKYVTLKMRFNMDINGVETELVALMSDYRDIEGYMIPFKTEQTFNGQTGMIMIYDAVKFNEQIDDSIFVKPASSGTPEQ